MTLRAHRASANAHQPSRVFAWPARVYYEDTDTLGMVYHANYLKYFERARVEWLDALGVDLPGLAARERQGFVVRKVDVTYLKPAALGEEIAATVQVRDVRGCYVELDQTVVRSGETLTQARVQIVYIDLDKLKPALLPPELRGKLQANL
jgi:acyl-CoA thioester hydrolase